MPVSAEVTASIAANRQRYLNLKAAGQAPAKPLPAATARGLAIDSARITQREAVPPGWYTSLFLRRGQALRLLNPQATPGVSLFAWNARDTSERYNAGDTVKIQWSAELRKGRLLFSDMGRVMLALIDDSCGAHDTLVGGSPSNRSGDPAQRNTRDNLVLAAGKLGLSRRDVGPCVTFFASVRTDAQGRFRWQDGRVQAGDFVDLRAEMDLQIALSNCPHPLAPETTAPQPIEAIVWNAPPAAADDLCRTLSVEAQRGYENTDAYVAQTGARA